MNGLNFYNEYTLRSMILNKEQTNQNTIKKLQWQCRRGMLELDVVLIPFLNEHFDDLSIEQKAVFAELLKEADPDLFTWIMGFGQCERADFSEIIKIIREKMSVA